FIRGDARGVDGDATLFADRRRSGQPLGEQAQHVERADQVDVDDADELRQRIDAVLADGALRSADAGAVHQDARDTVRGFRFGDRRLDRVFVGDVGVEGNALHFGGDFFGVFLVLVDHADFRALGSHGAGGGGAEAGATAGDENGYILQLHCNYLSFLGRFFSRWQMANRELRMDDDPFAIRYWLFAGLT